MSNLPAKYEKQFSITPRTMNDLRELGEVAHKSGYFSDAQGAAQAMMKIQAGSELGLLPVQSLTLINVIKGRITMSAALMAGLLKRAGYKLRVSWSKDPVGCTITVKDSTGEELGESSFDLDDAKRAGLQGGNWNKYIRNMCYARAVSNAARWYAPEVITGCYLPDEIDDAPQAPPPIKFEETEPLPMPRGPAVVRDAVSVEVAEVAIAAQQVAATELYESIVPSVVATLPGAPLGEQVQTEKQSRADINHYLHGLAKNHGLDHESLRGVLGVESMSDRDALPTEMMEHAVALLRAEDVYELKDEWGGVLPSSGYRGKLEALKEYCKGRLA